MAHIEKVNASSEVNAAGKNCLPGYLGIEDDIYSTGQITCQNDGSKPNLLAPEQGFLHAASIVALADSTCGYATMNNLPEGATGFTTIELKTNFLGTLLEGSWNALPTAGS
ncbi:MAG: hypothetical protein R2861_17000 [Desulfobacterales bacterium]